MPEAMKTTVDHGEIRRWVEARGGRPAIVTHEERGKDEAAVLRFEFPDDDRGGQKGLTVLDWQAFFEKFERMNRALMYQESWQMAGDDSVPSEQYRFVARDAWQAGRRAS